MMGKYERYGACGWDRLVEVEKNEFTKFTPKISWGSIGSVTLADAIEFRNALNKAIAQAQEWEE